MALLFKKANINYTIYELRTPDVTSAGAITLLPNALRSSQIAVRELANARLYSSCSGEGPGGMEGCPGLMAAVFGRLGWMVLLN